MAGLKVLTLILHPDPKSMLLAVFFSVDYIHFGSISLYHVSLANLSSSFNSSSDYGIGLTLNLKNKFTHSVVASTVPFNFWETLRWGDYLQNLTQIYYSI